MSDLRGRAARALGPGRTLVPLVRKAPAPRRGLVRFSVIAYPRRGQYIGTITRPSKLLRQVLSGSADANIPFEGLRSVLRTLGFDERVRGSHHIFTRAGVDEILNLQPRGANAKAYQVKQARQIIVRYKLAGDADEL